MDLHVHSPVYGFGPRHTLDGVTYEHPSSYEVTCDNVTGVPYRVELSVVMTPKGPKATRVALMQRTDERGRPAGPEVTSTAIRRLTVTDLLERSVHAVVAVVVDELPVADPTRERAARLSQASKADGAAVVSDRRRTVDDALLRRVAEVYRHALVLGRHDPTATVARELGVARSTAGRYVQQARDRDHLGPAPAERVAGEASEGGER